MYIYVYIYIYVCIIHSYVYAHIYIWVSVFVQIKGIDHDPSPVIHALPSEARHARSESTRSVAAH